jgi:hypothetical protein
MLEGRQGQAFREEPMDWSFVFVVLGIYGFVRIVTGVDSGALHIGNMATGAFNIVILAIPVALLSMLVLLITKNNRMWSGIVVGLFGWFLVGWINRRMRPRGTPGL